ncbi:AI-2E family transporter [Halarchaeum sp. CBA1220]|uniref:AI-2E family transporter n=1 Tax=Halarchaeum sp. CBA1220 TaxID=1853682 RepID=UPI000F3AA2A0|nr:AI-2E family transporter [Halarchaeum sp. CBA1220]QLC33395.1 AI-2E family transporter [Halarchaeum sp. CBA1220]
MPYARRTVLIGLFAAFAALAALLLHGVLGTVVFATTVAYLLVPVYRRMNHRLPAWWAAAATTSAATLGVLLPITAFAYLLYIRSSGVLALIQSLPDEFVLGFGTFSYVVDVATLTGPLTDTVRTLAVDAISALPVLGVKFTLFALLVFALLVAHEEAESAVLAAVPLRYHDVVGALARRARDTLYAIYVLQAATAFATFLVAVPVFWILGYPFPVTLALVCAVLQFLPIVGPSIVVGALALYQLSVGNVVGAVLVLVVAGALVAWLPDPVVRPRLSRHTARLPGSLYFIGFTGGLLTVGVIGIIAGPLVVALLVEAVSLLADEERKNRN